MKPTHNSRAVSLSAALAAAALTISSTAYAADYYWDNNDSTAGFGTAGGTWLNPTPGGTTGWSTDSTGASAIGSVTTATADTLFFGTDTVGLATGTVDIGAAVVNVSNLQFGKASGDITLTGGDIAMAGSTTYIRASSSGGSVSNTVTINNDLSKVSGTLTFGRQNTANEKYVMNGVLSGGFGVDGRVTNGSGQVYLNGLNTFTGNFSMTTGQYYVNTFADSGQASSLGAGNSISMGGGSGQSPRLIYTGSTATSTNRTLSVNANGNVGIIAQDGAVDLSGTVRANSGASTWNLFLSGTADTGTNTISGSMQDNGSGVLAVQINSTGATGVAGEAGYWDFTGNNTYTGNTTVANGSTLKISGAGNLGGGTYSSTLTINDTSGFHYDGDNLQVFDGTVQGSGTGGILATGAGQLRMVFGNNINYSGPVTVDGGSIQFRNTADLKGFTPNNLNIEGGGALAIQSSVGGNNRTSLNNKTWNFDNGGGTLTFNNGNHLFQGFLGSFHNFNVTAAGSGSSITSINGGLMNMQGSGNIEFDIADGAEDRDLTLSATWSNGLLTKDGAGTLAITGSHGGSYAIDINAGTLEVGNSATLAGGTFSAAIANDGTYKHNSSANQTISGVISGTGALTKDNTGTLTLTANNNFSGGTTVDGGTLQLTVDGRIGNGGLTVNNGGTFSIANDDFNSLGGAITVNEGGTLSTDSTVTGNAHNIGAITLNGGTLTSSGNTWFQGNWIFNGDVTVGGSALSTISGLAVGSQPSGGTFNVDDSVAGASTDLLVSADITLGSLTKTGAGTMELTGTGSYTGDTTVSAGTLSLASTYTHTGTGDFIVNGGTLEVADGVDISSSAMTISLGGVISPGNSPGTAITGDQTWNDGGAYLWEINDMAGGKGVDSGWDWLDIQGTLDINATFDILITSLTNPGNISGLADGFDTTGLSYLDPYASFIIATATGGVTGFDASDFNLDDSAFLNSKVGWSISWDEINNDIVLNAFFVPEPSSTALLGLGGLALMLRRKRS